MSRHFFPRAAAWLCVLCLLGGCATLRKKSAEKKAAKAAARAARQAENQPAPSKPIFSGTITLVNEASHFALIDGGYSANPPQGTMLKSTRQGADSGVLRVSAEKRRPFVIADIVSGEPAKGDRVQQQAEAPAATPAAAQ